MPVVCVPRPAARLPILKPLQSMMTLLTAMSIAVPAALAVETSLARHHVPCLLIVAGMVLMYPVQVWNDSAWAKPPRRPSA